MEDSQRRNMGYNADTLDKDDLEMDSMYFFEQDSEEEEEWEI
jgi:DNA repair protein RadC